MTNYNDKNNNTYGEGSLHRKLRLLRNRYIISISIYCSLAVILIATISFIAPHSRLDETTSNNVDETAETQITPVENTYAPTAGIVKQINDNVYTYLRKAAEIEMAQLLDFERNSNSTRDSFAEFVENFEEWCFDKEQLTIDFIHSYEVDDEVVKLADVSNVVNTVHQTGYVVALKPTYSQAMYYDYGNVDYYITVVADKTDNSTPWVHVTSDSNSDTLEFCQKSVITTTATDTVKAILNAVINSGDYTVQDGVLDNYYASCIGDLDDRLLTPAFANTAKYCVTRVDAQVCNDILYCVVTYKYKDSAANVSEETFCYRFSKDDSVIGYEFPSFVLDHATTDDSKAAAVLGEV